MTSPEHQDLDLCRAAARQNDDLATDVLRYARGCRELGYEDGALVAISVRAPRDLIRVTFGSWWAGYSVCFLDEHDFSRRDMVALEVGAMVQVCDAVDIIDHEDWLHRDVPAVAPAELVGMPVSWPPRCQATDAAIWIRGPHRLEPITHEDLLTTDRPPHDVPEVLRLRLAVLASRIREMSPDGDQHG